MRVEDWLGKDNILGIDIWNKKYRRNNESFDQWLDRVSGGDTEVRKLILEKKFLFGGRILSNRGVDAKDEKTTYSNCYVLAAPEDSIESIYETCKKLARTYSYGGGCGIDISKLAPAGAKVHNQAKCTSGAVSFMDTFSQVTEQIGQNGRRGALMISMSCDHPDIKKFITVKSDLNKVNYANISVRVTDDFMKAVEEDKPWQLRFVRPETGEEIIENVRAKELFDLLCEQNWNYAEPGILYWDNICSQNMLNNNPEFEYAGVNPCVSGDTLILTDKGYYPIENLSDKKANVWNGYEFSETTPHITGHNEKMLKVRLSDGSELRCTHYHKFVLNNGERIEARNLKIGDKLIKCSFPVIEGTNKIECKDAYTRGFFMGDGYTASDDKECAIKLYGAKRKLIEYIDHNRCTYCPSFDGEYLSLGRNTKYNKEFVPDASYTIQSRLDWLAGYIDSDGSAQNPDGGISISSINRDVLMKVKYMLNTLGCHASVTLMHEAADKAMPTHNVNCAQAVYHCQTSYRLLISAYNVSRLFNLGLNTHRVCPAYNPNRNASRFIYVKSIEEDGECDTVYCFNEPKNHTGIFNGVITAQCAEEPLPAGGSCLLGSLNLSAFVNEDGGFERIEFGNAVRVAVQALNMVLDEGLNKHPLIEQQNSVGDWRQIGLGIFGLADALIKMGIRYGSDDAIEFCDDLGEYMATRAIAASNLVAIERGAYNKYTDAVMDSYFFRKHSWQLTPGEKKSIAQSGLRNSQLLTIAPTGTLSTMLGVSGGIEPIFANSYTRLTKSLHGEDVEYKVYTPIVAKYMEEHNITDENELPDYFVTSATIPVSERVYMQSAWQDHIDASISSTVNLPESATVDDVREIYMLAWKQGLKGITIFRSGCARAAILTAPSSKKKEEDQVIQSERTIRDELDVIGLEHHLTTGCGSLHICAYFDKQGNLKNTYLSKGSSGGCNNFMIGLSRMISLAARKGVGIKEIVDQLNSCGTCPSYAVRRATKKDVSPGSCCPVAIGNALMEMWRKVNPMPIEPTPKPVEPIPAPLSTKLNKSICPECGSELIHEMGCVTCTSCGYSKCG